MTLIPDQICTVAVGAAAAEGDLQNGRTRIKATVLPLYCKEAEKHRVAPPRLWPQLWLQIQIRGEKRGGRYVAAMKENQRSGSDRLCHVTHAPKEMVEKR